MWGSGGGYRQTTTTHPARIFRRGTNERTVYSDFAKYMENTRGIYIYIYIYSDLGHIFRSIVRFERVSSDATQN